MNRFARCLVFSWLIACLTGCAYESIASYPQGDGAPNDSDSGMDGGLDDAGDAAMDADTGVDADSEIEETPPEREGGTEAGPPEEAGPTEEAGPDVDVPDPPEVLHVEPLFAFAPQWNDYGLKPDDAPLAIEACPNDQLNWPCVNGGLFRKLELPDEPSCTSLEAYDDEGWLDWVCDDTSGHVVFHSTGFAEGKSLRDVMSTETPEIKNDHVIVERNGVLAYETAHEKFWTNPVAVVPGAENSEGTFNLGASGTIYVIATLEIPMLRITSDKVSLVDIRDELFLEEALPTHESNTGALLSTEDVTRQYVWLEYLYLDANLIAHPVSLKLAHSRVDRLHTTRPGPTSGVTGADIDIEAEASVLTRLQSRYAPDVGVRVKGGSGVEGVLVHDAQGDCLTLEGTQYADIRGIELVRCGGVGLDVTAVSVVALSDVTIAITGQQGLMVSNADFFLVDDARVTDSGHNAVELASSTKGVTVQNLIASNSHGHGLVLGGQDHRVLRTISSSNDGDGIQLNARNSIVMNTTTANNTGAGVRGGVQSLFLNMVSVGNETGLALPDGADDNSVRQLFATDNTVDVVVGGDRNAFYGNVTLSSNTSCAVEGTANGSGIDDSPLCALAPPSDGSLATGTAAAAFVARIDGMTRSWMSVYLLSWTSVGLWEQWGRDFELGTVEARGPCVEGDECAVWLWSVEATAPLRDWLGPDPFVEAADEAHILEHSYAAATMGACERVGDGDSEWNETTSECTVRFVDYAYEGPFTRNRFDGLCWQDEDCTLYRNLGAYPGSGDLEVGTYRTPITFESFAGSGFVLSRFSENVLDY